MSHRNGHHQLRPLRRFAHHERFVYRHVHQFRPGNFLVGIEPIVRPRRFDIGADAPVGFGFGCGRFGFVLGILIADRTFVQSDQPPDYRYAHRGTGNVYGHLYRDGRKLGDRFQDVRHRRYGSSGEQRADHYRREFRCSHHLRFDRRSRRIRIFLGSARR